MRRVLALGFLLVLPIVLLVPGASATCEEQDQSVSAGPLWVVAREYECYDGYSDPWFSWRTGVAGSDYGVGTTEDASDVGIHSYEGFGAVRSGGHDSSCTFSGDGAHVVPTWTTVGRHGSACEGGSSTQREGHATTFTGVSDGFTGLRVGLEETNDTRTQGASRTWESDTSLVVSGARGNLVPEAEAGLRESGSAPTPASCTEWHELHVRVGDLYQDMGPPSTRRCGDGVGPTLP